MDSPVVVPAASPTGAVASARAMAARAMAAAQGHLAKPTVQSWLWYGGLPLLAFVLLSPGMVLTVPAAANCSGAKRSWFSYQTSVPAVLLHALVFFGLLMAIMWGGAALGIALPIAVPSKRRA